MDAPSGVRLSFSTRQDGDFHLDQDPVVLEHRRRRFVDLPWSQPDEHHGTRIERVRRPGDQDRVRADGLVTDVAHAVIGIWVGDCAPVALFSESGRVGGVHAGWRGIRDGILARAVAAMRSEPGELVDAVLGPCIHACCYEFGVSEVAEMAHRFGASVRAETFDGRPALDVPAVIVAALRAVGVDVDDRSRCTGCNDAEYFSHRVRGERGRQVMAVWRS